MSYLCDIYEKITGACWVIAIVGIIIVFSCPVMQTVEGAKKALCLGIFLSLIAGVVFLFLPSKEFVCGA